MLDNLVRGLLRQVAWNLGALLTFAGLIPPGMQAFDVLTTKPAVAGVEKVGHICQKQTCGSQKWNSTALALDIVCRGSAPYYVSRPFMLEATGYGLLISLLGLIMIASGRGLGTNKTQASKPVREPAPERTSRPQRQVVYTPPKRTPAVVRTNSGWFS